ncbi:MAG: hypothetical protein R3F11_13460 [Verrucomicrobiales bacterium]
MIFIFSGHGFLIAAFAALGGAGGLALGWILKIEIRLTLTAGLAGAALGAWLYELVLGGAKSQRTYDPLTKRYVTSRARNPNTLYFLPTRVWAFAITAVAVAGGIYINSMEPRDPNDATPAEIAFRKADLRIMSQKGGSAHGNTPAAIELSAALNEALANSVELAVEKTPLGEKVAGLEVFTYCQQTEGVCVFMLCLPKLRKLSRESKGALADAAWRQAGDLVQQRAALFGGSPPAKLVVAVRGIALYDGVWIGAPGGTPEKHSQDEREILTAFFDQPEAPPKSAAAGHALAGSGTSLPEAAPDLPAAEHDVPAPPVLPTAIRDWKAADGRKITGALLAYDRKARSAKFRRHDGREYDIPLEKFDAATQAEIERLTGGE